MRFTAAVRCSFRGGIVPDVTPCASTYHHPCNPFTHTRAKGCVPFFFPHHSIDHHWYAAFPSPPSRP